MKNTEYIITLDRKIGYRPAAAACHHGPTGERTVEDARREAEGIQMRTISARLNGLQKRQKKLAKKC